MLLVPIGKLILDDQTKQPSYISRITASLHLDAHPLHATEALASPSVARSSAPPPRLCPPYASGGLLWRAISAVYMVTATPQNSFKTLGAGGVFPTGIGLSSSA